MPEASKEKASPVGRRVILRVTGAGFAAAALPACAVTEFKYVPSNEEGGVTFPPKNGDAGSSPPDSGSTSSQPKDSGTTQQADSTVTGPEDSSAPPPEDTGTTVVDSNAPPPVDTGSPACATGANTLVVALSQYPQLANTGGSVALNDSRYSDPKCQGNDFYVVTTGPGEYAAFSASCTHACCTIQINGSSAQCPCHGATFDVATGKHTGGPGSNLPQLPAVCTDGTSLYIQLA
jgi:nitrite reductase/ring-hydroxylating ferredoxin subunit